jgi:hypothetical protein
MKEVNYNFTKEEAIKFAKESAKTVVIRSYINRDICDTRRGTTEIESIILEAAITAALLAIRDGCDQDSVITTAELFVIHYNNDLENKINVNESVSLQIRKFLSGHVQIENLSNLNNDFRSYIHYFKKGDKFANKYSIIYAKSIDELFNELLSMSFIKEDLSKNNVDYLIEICENIRVIKEFWLSEFLTNGIEINDKRYFVNK